MDKKHITLIVTVTIAIIVGLALTAFFAAHGVSPILAVVYTTSTALLVGGIVLGGLYIAKSALLAIMRLENKQEQEQPTEKAPVKTKKSAPKKPTEKSETKKPEKKAPEKKTSKKASNKKSSKK